jgi:glycerol-3-phosphate O-acyltransferase/dihydroxyacetone phosphate acyltransferase
MIIVGAPHHNQVGSFCQASSVSVLKSDISSGKFLDPLLLMSETLSAAGRRISFIAAEKSLRRKFIGASARLMMASESYSSINLVYFFSNVAYFFSIVSVVRAMDDAKSGQGLVYYDPDSEDFTLVHGYGTRFLTEFKPRMQIMLPRSLGSVTGEVVEIIDDETLRVKKPFSDKAKDALLAAGKRVKSGGAEGDGWEEKGGIKKNGIDYKTLPYVDQTQVCLCIFTLRTEQKNLIARGNRRCIRKFTRSSRKAVALASSQRVS